LTSQFGFRGFLLLGKCPSGSRVCEARLPESRREGFPRRLWVIELPSGSGRALTLRAVEREGPGGATHCQEWGGRQKYSKKSCASLETQKIPNKRLKDSLSQESELCYVQMREKRPQFIPIHDLSIKI
jgi:hypothetical protein